MVAFDLVLSLFMMLTHLVFVAVIVETETVDVKCADGFLNNRYCFLVPFNIGDKRPIHRTDKLKFHVAETKPIRGLKKTVIDCFHTIQMMEMNSHLFQVMPNLTKLEIFCPSIVNLTQNDFVGARNLRKLKLSFTGISCVKQSTFIFAPNLNELLFTANRIEKIEDYTFEDLNYITVLDLINSPLKHIGKFTFAGLSSLDTLRLHHYQLTEIDADAFNLPKLTSLDLTYNHLTVLPDGLFAQLPALIKLELYENQLQRVNNALYSMPSLQRLYLRKNQIEDFDLKRAASLPSLVELDLSENSLDAVDVTSGDISASKSKLETLWLRRNNITNGNIFAKLAMLFPNLVKIYLRYNSIKTMDLEAVRTGGLSKLQIIEVDGNEMDKGWLETKAGKLAIELIYWTDEKDMPGKIVISNKFRFFGNFETVIKLKTANRTDDIFEII